MYPSLLCPLVTGTFVCGCWVPPCSSLLYSNTHISRSARALPQHSRSVRLQPAGAKLEATLSRRQARRTCCAHLGASPEPRPARSERAPGEVFTVVSQVVHEAAALDASACRPPRARPSGCPSRENRGASLRPRPGEGRSLSQVCPHRCCTIAATPEDLRGRTSRPWRPLSQHQW